MINNVALVPVPQQSDSVIPPLHTYIYLFFIKFFSQLGYYITLSRVPCAIQKVLAGCPFKHGSGGSVHVASSHRPALLIPLSRIWFAPRSLPLMAALCCPHPFFLSRTSLPLSVAFRRDKTITPLLF